MLTVVGMGPDGVALMTQAAVAAVAQAQALAGGRRQLAQFPAFAGESWTLDADIPALLRWLERRRDRNVVVLASGDPLFFGIAKRLTDHFGRENLRVIPGISAVQYLCAQAGIDMNDIWLTSSHGREIDFAALAAHRKVGLVTDRRRGPREIAVGLTARGLGRRWLAIGENLATARERIVWRQATQISDEYELNAVVILDER